jgi:hypothetical protein
MINDEEKLNNLDLSLSGAQKVSRFRIRKQHGLSRKLGFRDQTQGVTARWILNLIISINKVNYPKESDQVLNSAKDHEKGMKLTLPC